MNDRTPITTAVEAACLDDDELLEGYFDGYAGEPEPGDNRSKSYWQGWGSGNNDRLKRSDPDRIALARSIRLSRAP